MDLGLEALSKVTGEFTNNCPICGRPRYYKRKEYLDKSNRNPKPCRSCANSIKSGGTGAVYNDKGEKLCISCQRYKPPNEFYKNKKNNLHSLCKECSPKDSKEYHKEVYRYKKYDITKEDFEQLVENQGGKCKICNKRLNEEIHIDHNHRTGKVRGVLCGKCNKGLGQFEDDITILTNAIKYLKDE